MLLDAAMKATLIALAAKVFSVIVLANMEGATVELRTFAAIVPYLAITASPPVFLEISTYSTLVMAAAAAAYLVPTVVQSDFPTQKTWGRILGVVISAETLTLQVVIHYVGWSNIRVDRVWWVVMALLAGILLSAAGLGFDLRSPMPDPELVEPEERQSSPELAPAA